MAAHAQFDSELAGLTGLDPGVVRAWDLAEGGPAGNPLNIGPGRDYGDEHGAAVATAQLLADSSYYAGIRNAVRTRRPGLEVAAIKLSPWDASHYANGVLDRTYAEVTGMSTSSRGGTPVAPNLQVGNPQGGGGSPLNWNPIDGFGIPGLITGGVGGVAHTIAAPFEKAYSVLTSQGTWIRVGFFVLALALVAGGLYVALGAPGAPGGSQ